MSTIGDTQRVNLTEQSYQRLALTACRIKHEGDVLLGNSGREHLQCCGCSHLDDALERCIHCANGPCQATALHDVRHQAWPACHRNLINEQGLTWKTICTDGENTTSLHICRLMALSTALRIFLRAFCGSVWSMQPSKRMHDLSGSCCAASGYAQDCLCAGKCEAFVGDAHLSASCCRASTKDAMPAKVRRQ